MNGDIFFYRILVLIFMSSPVYADCSGGDGANYRTFDMGAQYVPRDAPVGSVIGTAEVAYSYKFVNPVLCSNGDRWEAKNNNWPVVTNVAVPPMREGVASAAIVKTNIPGVGLIVVLKNGLGSYFNPVSGVSPYVPYVLATRVDWGYHMRVEQATFTYTLVKISEDIPFGTSRISNANTAGYLQSGTNRFVGVYLTGTVVRSECSVAGGGNAYIEVPMGRVERREFSGKYTYVESKDFSIPLTSCVAGTYPTGQAWNYYQNSNAHIKFEGVQGSSIIDVDKGILGLTQDSTAKGVGVQILRKDGVTPLSLGQDVSIAQLKNTSMNIELKARYIQTSASHLGPEPGKANARAAFTVTYK